MDFKGTEFFRRAVLAAIMVALAGCAAKAPKPTYAQPIAVEQHVAATDQASVKVDAASGISILETEKARLAEKIGIKINDRKSLNKRDGDARNYSVELVLTRYEKGNAFARAMLAGLGQIHIDGDVTMYALPDHSKVGEFHLKKTFAWGGIYGSSTTMEDIETTFADGVAAAVTGQQEAPDKKKK
jgi:hypothetical protein